ncbi:MAG: hypothetical protein V2I45_10525 [Halieaceae bacterium]|nr:hypothetical protein [Halieaceae bacterium]
MDSYSVSVNSGGIRARVPKVVLIEDSMISDSNTTTLSNGDGDFTASDALKLVKARVFVNVALSNVKHVTFAEGSSQSTAQLGLVLHLTARSR